MLDRNKFEIEREQFLKAFCEKITFILGLEMNAKFNEARFYRFTDIAFELANFGTMDNFLGFDEFDLVAFVETMETMLPTVANNMNIEEEYPTLTTAVSCLGLYSSLYIVEDEDVANYCEISHEAVAAVLGVKVSTLKNMVSLKSLAAMNNQELRQYLESQERFKPFKQYDSVSLDAPLDLSNVTTCNALIYAIEQRAIKYNVVDALETVYSEAGVNADSDSNIKFIALFSLYGDTARKIGSFLGKLNLDLPSLNVAVENVAHEMTSALANSFSLLNHIRPPEKSGEHATQEATNNPYVFQRPNIPFTADNLGDYLKVEHDFSTHPDDKSKNKKLFAVKKGNLSLAIERTKTPSIWITHNMAKRLNSSDFEITWYESSEDGVGRHSGLHTYKEFHTAAIAKVKVKSFDHAERLISQLL